MALYGYARVSSLDQDVAIQEEKLRAAGCQVIRAEKRSGTGRAGRTRGKRMRSGRSVCGVS